MESHADAQMSDTVTMEVIGGGTVGNVKEDAPEPDATVTKFLPAAEVRAAKSVGLDYHTVLGTERRTYTLNELAEIMRVRLYNAITMAPLHTTICSETFLVDSSISMETALYVAMIVRGELQHEGYVAKVYESYNKDNASGKIHFIVGWHQ